MTGEQSARRWRDGGEGGGSTRISPVRSVSRDQSSPRPVGNIVELQIQAASPPRNREHGVVQTFPSAIRPYSRIENTRTDAVVPISPLLEKDDPSQLKRRLIRKITFTAIVATMYPVLWMVTFFPHDLDGVFGDGYLRASPSIVKSIDGKPHELSMSIDRLRNVKLELDEPFVELFYGEDEHSNIFKSDDLKVGKISKRDLSKEPIFVTLISCVTFIVLISCIFMWLPTKYLVGSRKRRAASALHALGKGR